MDNNDLISQLLQQYKTQDDLFSEDGLVNQLMKVIAERGDDEDSLSIEKTFPTKPKPENSTGEIGTSTKTSTRFVGIDEKVINLYAGGMTTREIQSYLRQSEGVNISKSLISTITDGVLGEMNEWKNRALDSVYPIVYMDALRVKVRSNGRVTNKPIYIALAITLSGHKEVLGFWAAENEGAKFWLQILTELRNRGVQDIFIACVDGLTGFPEAIEAAFPKTQVQICMVHVVRNLLRFVSDKDRAEAQRDFRAIYTSPSLDEAEHQLSLLEKKWQATHPYLIELWRLHWAQIAPMFGYPPDIRRAIYTTNPIESLHMTLRKISKNRALFPSDEAVFKLFYLALRNISQRWTLPIVHWSGAINHFAIIFEGRVPLGGLEFGFLLPNNTVNSTSAERAKI